jgi:small ligand-binding sensory domain FIST
MMFAGASLACTRDPAQAATTVVHDARAALGDQEPSLGVLFASTHFLRAAEDLLSVISDHLGPVPLIGCVAESVIGGGREIEEEPAVALWLATGIGPVETFTMEFVRTDGGGFFGGYQFERSLPGLHVLISDPFSFPVHTLLRHLNAEVPDAVIVGGLAGAGAGPGENRLFLDGHVLSGGAVGVHLPDADARPLVSQGCRPLGAPFTVTAARGNVILGLGGRPPVSRLEELARALPERDLQLLSRGLQVGTVINEHKDEWDRGDFLVRGVLGADSETGAIAVGDEVSVGQTVQFQVRDARSADEDLRATLERARSALGGGRVAGALLFTCNGRGTHLFSEPDHDASLLHAVLGDVPTAGFFCAGEVGPVGGQNFLHGFTASMALFVDADR